MSLSLDNTNKSTCTGSILIPGSKSESNRLLILQQLFPSIAIENLSTSDDTTYLKKALQSTSDSIHAGNAGTNMRFLTAFFASREGKTITLMGSARIHERPIKILVEALRNLGANITYLKNEGFPPLLIKGKKISVGKIHIKSDVSSQYISALLLVAPTFHNGLELVLEGEITSMPYIQMTTTLLDKVGVNTNFIKNTIRVEKSCPDNFRDSGKTNIYRVEPDWSSASYFYGLAALQPNTRIELLGFKKNSLQGDSALTEIYRQFGVRTQFTEKGIILTNENQTLDLQRLALDLNNTPDLAQTIAVTCLGLGIDCQLIGLHTLKIKETNRLQALKNELERLGATVKITDDSLKLIAPSEITRFVRIQTYEDHRMAMAFAPLSVRVPIVIENSKVVSKSYPTFWEDFDSIMKK